MVWVPRFSIAIGGSPVITLVGVILSQPRYFALIFGGGSQGRGFAVGSRQRVRSSRSRPPTEAALSTAAAQAAAVRCVLIRQVRRETPTQLVDLSRSLLGPMSATLGGVGLSTATKVRRDRVVPDDGECSQLMPIRVPTIPGSRGRGRPSGPLPRSAMCMPMPFVSTNR